MSKYRILEKPSGVFNIQKLVHKTYNTSSDPTCKVCNSTYRTLEEATGVEEWQTIDTIKEESQSTSNQVLTLIKAQARLRQLKADDEGIVHE